MLNLGRYFLLMLVTLSVSSHALSTEPHEVVSIDDTFQHVHLSGRLSSVRTPANAQLSDIQHHQDWQVALDNQPLKSQQSLWMRFGLNNTANQTTEVLLTLDNPALDSVDVFVLDQRDRILHSFLVGAARPLENRAYNHRNVVLPINVPDHQQLHIYIRVIDDGPMVFSTDIWSKQALVAREQINLAFIGVIGGALAILACYFLITYALLRSPIRFWFGAANGALFLLFLNLQGIITQFIGAGQYLPHTTTLLLALVLLAGSKVSHRLLVDVPLYWRTVSYCLCAALLPVAVLLNAYWQLIADVALVGALITQHLVLALLFHNRENTLPNRLYALGWLVVAATAGVDVVLFLNGIILPINVQLLLTFMLMAGMLLFAVAIEAHEQGEQRQQHQHQQATISDLQQFYNLFRNSAEGLYTSTLEGKLITTNPAMCSLFGYDDEAQMMAEVDNTAQFYAQQQDREVLLGELLQSGIALGKEIKGKRRDGSEFWFSISAQLHTEGATRFLSGSIFDITERKQSSISLEYLATHDSLTGVYNRREFERRLRSALEHASQGDMDLTLLYMDLDQFKVVNDTCGHKAGDVLIKQLSQQLNNVVSNKGTLARLGGDEFGVLLEQDNAQMAYQVANQILTTVQEFRFMWENRVFTLGVSIGQVPWHPGITSSEQLLSMADAACYMAKERGRNQVHTYSADDKQLQRYESELNWVTQLNQALEHDQFVLYYQHYHPLNKKIAGHHYELLLRMRDGDGKIIPPSAFLPAAERYNLTSAIDKWVIECYFKWLADNPAHCEGLNYCNINLSGHSLADKELKLFVLNAFEKYNVPYQKICFEITESMAIVKMDETLEFIETFHQLGCAFALDDFGSGFSSYSYLKHLPVNYVKIDGSFVKDLLVDPIDMAMVNSIKDIAKAMGMGTVAEFVETKEIMVELGKIGVDYAQGYGVAKPAPLEEFSPYQG
ncbi:EAL domain-containing protein [Aestuariibacter halophilus]|uniref:EAL domain-containing protein n=1 Tax=Fluctibacter halophilus TaxID=226011 RepID=A0ABS8GAW4_9ALTE|nr:EAL domain-containing protein [Aestuariibacter halophilus]MCC2617569.1 EAL domain-containing protein [Aestuariibacter halophilus]